MWMPWNPDEASMVIGPSINCFRPFFPRLKFDSFWTINPKALYERA